MIILQILFFTFIFNVFCTEHSPDAVEKNLTAVCQTLQTIEDLHATGFEEYVSPYYENFGSICAIYLETARVTPYTLQNILQKMCLTVKDMWDLRFLAYSEKALVDEKRVIQRVQRFVPLLNAFCAESESMKEKIERLLTSSTKMLEISDDVRDMLKESTHKPGTERLINALSRQRIALLAVTRQLWKNLVDQNWYSYLKGDLSHLRTTVSAVYCLQTVLENNLKKDFSETQLLELERALVELQNALEVIHSSKPMSETLNEQIDKEWMQKFLKDVQGVCKDISVFTDVHNKIDRAIVCDSLLPIAPFVVSFLQKKGESLPQVLLDKIKCSPVNLKPLKAVSSFAEISFQNSALLDIVGMHAFGEILQSDLSSEEKLFLKADVVRARQFFPRGSDVLTTRLTPSYVEKCIKEANRLFSALSVQCRSSALPTIANSPVVSPSPSSYGNFFAPQSPMDECSRNFKRRASICSTSSHLGSRHFERRSSICSPSSHFGSRHFERRSSICSIRSSHFCSRRASVCSSSRLSLRSSCVGVLNIAQTTSAFYNFLANQIMEHFISKGQFDRERYLLSKLTDYSTFSFAGNKFISLWERCRSYRQDLCAYCRNNEILLHHGVLRETPQNPCILFMQMTITAGKKQRLPSATKRLWPLPSTPIQVRGFMYAVSPPVGMEHWQVEDLESIAQICTHIRSGKRLKSIPHKARKQAFAAFFCGGGSSQPNDEQVDLPDFCKLSSADQEMDLESYADQCVSDIDEFDESSDSPVSPVSDDSDRDDPPFSQDDVDPLGGMSKADVAEVEETLERLTSLDEMLGTEAGLITEDLGTEAGLITEDRGRDSDSDSEYGEALVHLGDSDMVRKFSIIDPDAIQAFLRSQAAENGEESEENEEN